MSSVLKLLGFSCVNDFAQLDSVPTSSDVLLSVKLNHSAYTEVFYSFLIGTSFSVSVGVIVMGSLPPVDQIRLVCLLVKAISLCQMN